MALSADSPVVVETGDFNSVPAAASAKVYEGSMVGSSSGYGRALVAADVFFGHSLRQVDNSSGSAGDKNIRLRKGKYRLKVTITAAITNIAAAVYASDDGTYTLTSTSNSLVGKLVRWISSTESIVEFDPIGA